MTARGAVTCSNIRRNLQLIYLIELVVQQQLGEEACCREFLDLDEDHPHGTIYRLPKGAYLERGSRRSSAGGP